MSDLPDIDAMLQPWVDKVVEDLGPVVGKLSELEALIWQETIIATMSNATRKAFAIIREEHKAGV